MAAPSLPTNNRVSFGGMSSSGSELFISSVVTLSGAGAANVPHGMQSLSGTGGRTLAGDAPPIAFIIPLTDGDYSSVALSVDSTNVILTAGPSGGKLLVLAIRL